MYSQNDEEKIIAAYYPHWFKGTVLDIGANDGQTLSNSRALILNGWDAVLVEPDPEAQKRLIALYPWDKNSAVHPGIWGTAIADKKGTLPFYSVGDHLGKGDTGLLSTLNLEELKTRFPGVPYTITEVPVTTWPDFYACLKASVLPKIAFDVISIDAEGMDLAILTQIDLKETKTSLVCVEYNGKDEYKYGFYCNKFGLKLIHKNSENLIYAL